MRKNHINCQYCEFWDRGDIHGSMAYCRRPEQGYYWKIRHKDEIVDTCGNVTSSEYMRTLVKPGLGYYDER